MSAFICGDDHLKALAVFAIRRDRFGPAVDPRYVKGFESLWQEPPAKVATAYADCLYRENVRSVRSRYPEDKWDDLPGPIVKPLHIVVSGRDITTYCKPSPVEILKMCDCLEYQSCETDDYEQSPAYALLEKIRRAAWQALPGYQDAQWCYELPAQPNRSKAA